MLSIKSTVEHWPVAGEFRISRSTLSEITVVVVEVAKGRHIGRGECRPYARYNETAQTVQAQISSLGDKLESLTLDTLQDFLPAGAARNAVDCALWDLRAQMSGENVAQMLCLSPARACRTAFTLSIDRPDAMRKAAQAAGGHSLLKIKIGDYDGGLAAALAIMDARPDAELIIDANEALSTGQARAMQYALARYPVVVIEQPTPAGERPQFDPLALPIICADEALHTAGDLTKLWAQGYRAVNIKLDKTGGLSEAVKTMKAARAMGFVIMLGCMVGTSLAMAPAFLLSPYADIVDLDGALLLAKDREGGLRYKDGCVDAGAAALWGHPKGPMRAV